MHGVAGVVQRATTSMEYLNMEYVNMEYVHAWSGLSLQGRGWSRPLSEKSGSTIARHRLTCVLYYLPFSPFTANGCW